jgi:predicted transcriptional regulator YdeE/DNA-binding transcriptional MerR regulator
MFKIGDFAKLSRVPVKTLRYYDEIGLLKPVGVDRFTRYRYYALEQLPILYRILGLKDLGFSLEQVGQLLEGDLTPSQLRHMLEKRRGEIEAQIALGREQLARLDLRLEEIDQAGRLPDYGVILKKIEPQWVASIGGIIPSYAESEPIFDRLFDEIYSFVLSQGLRCSQPGIAIYHDPQAGDENFLVEAACSLPRPIPASGAIRVYQLVGVDNAASVIHHGPFATIGQAYSAVIGWVEAHNLRICGPTREVYLQYERGGDQNRYVTEIQIPVTKQKEYEKMEPRIVDLESFNIIGLPYIGSNEHEEIGQMWDVFNQRYSEIPNVASEQAAYGVCYEHPTERMEYIAAYKVNSLTSVPEGMVGKQVPAQKYVVFPCEGLENIGETYHKIISQWLPENGYMPGGGPDFEYYGEEFNPQDESGILYIYFPIKKAAVP